MSRIHPVLRYEDAPRAIDWLCEAFGFERHEVHTGEDGRVVHAELLFGEEDVIGVSSDDQTSPFGRHAGRGWVYVAVEDADAADDAYERAQGAGAEVVMEIADQDYGSRDFTVRDPEGNLWSFGTYRMGGA